MNKPYECEPFGSQDIELVLAFNKVKKFMIKDPKDLKAGQLFINVRETLALDNIMVVPVWVDGKPIAVANADFNTGLRYPHARSVDNLKGKYRNDLAIWAAGKGENYIPKTRKELKHCQGGIYAGTLMRHNLCFRYNTKVKQFMEMLKRAPRFQQHCILKDVPYTRQEYSEFVSDMEMRKFYDHTVHNELMTSEV
jgi:hypothetical protein